MSYNKQELVNEVYAALENLHQFHSNDEELDYIEVRLQLVDGSYNILTGDSQYDTDHRGAWGYGGVDCTRMLIEDELLEDAESIVDEALDEYYDQKLESRMFDYHDCITKA